MSNENSPTEGQERPNEANAAMPGLERNSGSSMALRDALGHSLLLGALCAAVWAVLPFLRHGGSLAQFALLAAGSLPSFSAVIFLVRSALPLPAIAPAAALGVLVSVPAWAGLGMFLKSYTHHRQLGGVVFGIAALAVAALAIAVVTRLLRLAEGSRGAQVVLAALSLGAVGGLFYLSVPLAANDFATATLRAWVTDAIVGLGLVVAAVRGPSWRWPSGAVAKLGYGAGFVCLALGVGLMVQRPGSVGECGNAPLQCGVFNWLR